MKNVILIIISLFISATSFAHDIGVENSDGVLIYYNYTNDGKELEVTFRGDFYSENNEYTGDVVIPDELTYMNITRKVTSIGEHAFDNCSGLTSVTIPNSVTSIGDSAFEGCSGLTSVTIPNSVTSIGQGTFYNCSGLTSVTIPNSVTSIGKRAFYGCTGLTSVTIGNSVTSIGNSAFEGCSGLTSVTIPNSVTSIGNSAFYGCTGLTSVTIPNSVASIGFKAFEGCSGLISITVGNGVKIIYQDAFKDCSALQKVIISDIAAWCGIYFLNAYGNPLYWAKHLYRDENSEIKNLVIPNSVTSISFAAFFNCSSLTSVTIPNSVTSIEKSAFYGCTGLTSVTIPNSVTSIGNSAFGRCTGLTSVTIGNSVTSIGNSAFEGCSGLTSVTIPNSVTSIGNWTFYNCSGLTSITIPNSVTSIGLGAFDGIDYPTVISQIENPFEITGKTSDNRTFSQNTYNNATLYVPKGSIAKYKATNGWKDFLIIEEDRSLDGVKINGIYYNLNNKNGIAEVTGNPNKYFGNVIIPESVTYKNINYSVTDIGEKAFQNCSGLTSITIPNSVKSIEGSAFEGCKGLVSIAINNNSIVSKNYTSSSTLAQIFGSQVKKYKIGDNVTGIGSYAFSGCTGLTSVTIPNSVTSIGNGAFEGCSGLTSVTIPNSVTSIGNWTFYNCSGLTSITIPNSVKSISLFVFANCTGLTSVTIPYGVTSIGNSAFEGCSGLTSVTIPNSVTSIGNWTFYNCSGLTSITIPNSVTSIGLGAFDGIDYPTVISQIENPFEITGKTSDNRTFSQNTYNNATLYVPKGSIAKYKATNGWKDFVLIKEVTQEIEDVVTEVKSMPVLIQRDNGTLNISGAPEGTDIYVYDTSGKLLASAIANSGTTQMNITVKEKVAIVKIGDRMVKVLMK